MPTYNMSPLEEAKARLDLIINKARAVEFKKEFPQAAEIVNFLEERTYLTIPSPDLWHIDLVGNLQ